MLSYRKMTLPIVPQDDPTPQGEGLVAVWLDKIKFKETYLLCTGACGDYAALSNR